MTRKMQIMEFLNEWPQQTCAELTRQIAIVEKIPADSNKAHYLNGAVSSVLRKMVIAGDIQVIGHDGPRGGKCYCLAPKQTPSPFGKISVSNICDADLEKIRQDNIKKARAFYAARPFVTKVYMALHGFTMSFLQKNWEEITK